MPQVVDAQSLQPGRPGRRPPDAMPECGQPQRPTLGTHKYQVIGGPRADQLLGKGLDHHTWQPDTPVAGPASCPPGRGQAQPSRPSEGRRRRQAAPAPDSRAGCYPPAEQPQPESESASPDARSSAAAPDDRGSARSSRHRQRRPAPCRAAGRRAARWTPDATSCCASPLLGLFVGSSLPLQGRPGSDATGTGEPASRGTHQERWRLGSSSTSTPRAMRASSMRP
jgi:hypothetical protein